MIQEEWKDANMSGGPPTTVISSEDSPARKRLKITDLLLLNKLKNYLKYLKYF
ncbi:hypothetical protein [Methanobacterium petrolearium]|uniref:hypothetical protein n=1 Tax=Methanobacterium petrolearium TaxID=710190 RepID=UPI001AE92DEB|nr:hypothetical protein [Methanobacterium petrolearium]MBP1946513.1 hypothetical protein [Methanobacterium petrolearium]BDZ69854.1 hypothetical protein GCM10025861_03710 [Methanobacterium petrolearium]